MFCLDIDIFRYFSKKANWVITHNIGGAFTWDTSLDDFSGQFCNEGTFPLIRTAMDTLSNTVNPIVVTTIAPTIAPTIVLSTLPKTSPATVVPTVTFTTVKPTTYPNTGSLTCDGRIGYFPYPYDCSKFLECNVGIVRIGQCPATLVFNPNAQACDW